MGTTSNNIAYKIPEGGQRENPDAGAKAPKGYPVIFKNDSVDAKPWNIWFPDRGTVIVQPGHCFETTILSGPDHIYARWEKIVWKGGIDYEFTVRPGWVEKKEGWVVEFLNEHGANVEIVQILGDEYVKLPRGIPVRKAVSAISEISEYGKYFIRRVSLGASQKSHFEDVDVYEEKTIIDKRRENYADKHVVTEKTRKRIEVFDPAVEQFEVRVVLEDRRSGHDLKKIVEQRKEIHAKEAKFRQEIG